MSPIRKQFLCWRYPKSDTKLWDKMSRSLYPYHPDFLAQRMSIAHGEKCSSTISSIINSDHPLGLPSHITVSLHEA